MKIILTTLAIIIIIIFFGLVWIGGKMENTKGFKRYKEWKCEKHNSSGTNKEGCPKCGVEKGREI